MVDVCLSLARQKELLRLSSGKPVECRKIWMECMVEIIRIVDGDTVVVRVCLAEGSFIEESVRIIGIDAPEISRPKSKVEKELGLYVKEYIGKILPVGSIVVATIYGIGNFGRPIADITLENGERLTDHLLNKRMAREYSVREGRKKWSEKECHRLLNELRK